ncbi:MAG: hypothetical protein FWH16_00145 [Oscillospiraceae bacterium]|nr:hypothetical protein [Oscillospiraceae bacterium]
MQIYLAATPDDARSAAAYGYPLAHMAYYKTFEQHGRSGGWMVLGGPLAGGIDPREAVEECRRRDFSGLLLDFESGDRQALTRFVLQADELCAQYNLTLITGKKFQTERSLTLVPSGAVSGSLRQRLIKYGAGAVLEIVRLAQDIPLPAPQGRGITMTHRRLGELLESRRPVTFFSSELLARYFTYKDESGVTHFIIYDDAESISKKIRLAGAIGFPYAVMLYSEVKDLLGNIS